VAAADSAESSGPAEARADLELWRRWLSWLVTDASRLPGFVQLKYSSVNEVIKAMLSDIPDARSGRPVIAKRSSPGGLAARIMAVAGRSRARRNFHRGLRLARLGIGTAAPLAFVERPAGGESWLVTEYLADLVELDQIALTELPQMSPRDALRRKRVLIAEVARLFVQLRVHRIHHRDLKATNILVSGWRTGTEVRAFLVDLDGLRERSWRPIRHGRQRLMRLAASLAEYPSVTRSDYCRFLRSVVGADAWQAEWRRLQWAGAAYNASAEVRRGRKWARREC